jgi:TatD DNase family protein
VKLIDTHSHLFARHFSEDIAAVLKRTEEAGVYQVVLPNIDTNTVQAMLALESTMPSMLRSAIGLHPGHVDDDYETNLMAIKSYLGIHNWVAIGECGLDYFHSTDHIQQQKKVLATQIGWAKTMKLPLILHTRDAFQDTYEMIKDAQDGNLHGVFHCFTGTADEAKMVADLGFYIGIGGVITYPKGGLAETVVDYPREYVVLETDSPYLPPTPHRGKRNESGYLPLIAQKLADCWRVTLEDVAATTTRNATQLFKLD